MTRTPFALLAAALAAAPMSAAGPPADVLDFTLVPKLWGTHFGRYGAKVTKAVFPDATGVRLRLPPEPKGAAQVGLYSYFALSGDCEASADYEVYQIPPPTAGYGAGFGLVLDSKGPAGEVAVRRGVWQGEGSGVQLVTGVPDEKGDKKYTAQFFPTTAKKGRIILRREKAEVVLLTADSPGGEGEERARVPFTPKVIRELRVVLDGGGSPTVVDGRLSNLRVTGQELTGGIPEREKERTPGWVYALSVAVAAAVVVTGWRWLRGRLRKRAAEAEAEEG